MKELLSLFCSFIYFLVLFYLLDFWYADPESYTSDSETHARNRYALAEKIIKELEER